MKHLFFIAGLSLFAFTSLRPQPLKTEKLELSFHKNIELIGLAYFIGFEGVDIENKTIEVDGKTMPKKEWHRYGYKIYQEYQAFASSENLAKSFSVADHLWLDYINALLLQTEEVPNAKLTPEIKESFYINFSKTKDLEEAKKNVEIFLDGLNAFSEEINFEAYISNSKVYYDRALQEIENSLPEGNFINTMESFYQKKFDSYALIPSLTTPKGMGFGIRITDNNQTTVFNVFGATDVQDLSDTSNLQMGFANKEKLQELSVHEFGHSFVNPVVAQLPDSMFKQTEHLFIPIKPQMETQGYNSWKVCVYEHFVRAGEVVISEKMGNKAHAKKLLTDYTEYRAFEYLPEIISELKKFDQGNYKTFEETVQKTMEMLSNKT
ncbi:DUF4932 domain-containing protein [Mangrovimonas sp. DI 80]|uniref:DUF4932 domain-containing protein n=1 Tax=Mangrovimonas sp. DI 80 TaxID=1779330 RepID=UPI000976535A|nr:DUF4932 domain-containing protein [Mangrovimonas sp. DI 80]OMP32848.1 hypothetical protein BKM32_00630 [Mangrovimonas sp. DI 80]